MRSETLGPRFNCEQAGWNFRLMVCFELGATLPAGGSGIPHWALDEVFFTIPLYRISKLNNLYSDEYGK